MRPLIAIIFTLFIGCTKHSITNQISDSNSPIGGKKTYTVNFNTNGGTTVSAITVEEGKTIATPTAPTKTGFTIEGWYKETGLTNKWNFTTDVVNTDVTLYAKWLNNNMVFVEKGTATSGPTIDKSFYIQKYEVTQGEFQALMVYNPSHFTGKPNNPVEKVTWYDALEYANRLSVKEGLLQYYTLTAISKSGDRITSATVTENTSANGYRLPTEEEWVYAARGGKESKNYTYSGSNNYDDVAWVGENNTINGTKVVGGKLANELGIYDMSGNVWEWTNSLWVTGNTGRVCRGGCWVNFASEVTVISRLGYNPGGFDGGIGFRLVRSF